MNIKNLYCKISKPINNKFKEIQIYLNFNIAFNFNLDIKRNDKYDYYLDFDFLNLFTFNICKTKNTDHAGFYLSLNIIYINIEYNNLDIRHWDYDNNCFEK